MNRVSSIETKTLLYAGLDSQWKVCCIMYCMIQGAQIRYSDNLEGWDGVGGGKEAQEGGDIHIPVADSC